VSPLPFIVSKDEWHTKKDTGKSINNALCVLRYAPLRLKLCQAVNPITLVIVELCEGISQVV